MTDLPFSLKGKQEYFSGSTAGSIKTREFDLLQGLVIAQIEHDGLGDFKLEFVSEGSAGRGFWTKFPTGVAVIGTIAGGPAGGLLGFGVSSLLRAGARAFSDPVWTAFKFRGPGNNLLVSLAHESNDGCIRPAKYRLEGKTAGKWSCRIIQPDVGQSIGPMADANQDAGFHIMNHSGICVSGPFTSGRRPLLANIQHVGKGEFIAIAYSVDGTHHCLLHDQEGQFFAEDVKTDIQPGKEYMLFVEAEGKWLLSFTEGY